MAQSSGLVAVDVGGTFTDVVYQDRQGSIRSVKVPTRPDSRAAGVLAGVAELGLRPTDVDLLIHGTTVATNAILERSGATVGFITTKGFRDVLEIQRENKAWLYDLRYRKAPPLVSRPFRREVEERVGFDGSLIAPIDVEDVQSVARELIALGAESLAVGFLFSYVNPANEEAARKAIVQATEGRVPVDVSADVAPIWREYTRFSTVAAQSYLRPAMEQYLDELSKDWASSGNESPIWIMQSNGGITPVAAAARYPVRLVVSGPAAGVVAGREIGASAGFGNVVTVDIGGTSTDVGVVVDGEIRLIDEREVDRGVPIAVPSVDVHTVGAGGGSIIGFDPAGGLTVGPASAGADPGPACYGRGGTRPTVTDANLILGRLNADVRLGRSVALAPEKAWDAMRSVASVSDNEILNVAEAAIEVATSEVASAIRLMVIERGLDPRRFALVAQGGAGPLIAPLAARSLSINTVIVPREPGVSSAWGLLVGNLRVSRVRSARFILEAASCVRLWQSFRELQGEAESELREHGISWEADLQIRESIIVRYAGQTHEFTVDISDLSHEPTAWYDIATAAHAAHDQLYSFASLDEPIEVIGFRLVAELAGARTDWYESGEMAAAPVDAPEKRTRSVFLGGEWHDSAIYDRDSLQTGQTFSGPAIVEQWDCTTLVPAGSTASVMPNRDLLIQLEGEHDDKK